MPSKAAKLRRLLKRGIVVMPGAHDAITAMLVERAGFNAVYITGSGVATALAGLPDIGLMTLSEVAGHARYIAGAVDVPAVCDADTGYGEVLNVMRAVREFESAGVAGIHIEDQRSPKKCGHLPGKQLISKKEMVQKVLAAVEAKSDPDFLVIARTDARGVAGLRDAIDRARAYVDAGADGVFPEGLKSLKEFEDFASKVDSLLLANMTEFGVTPYMSVEEFERAGYDLVIFPLTALRTMLKAAAEALEELNTKGTQKGILSRMMTRDEVYEIIGYRDYEEKDMEIAERSGGRIKRVQRKRHG